MPSSDADVNAHPKSYVYVLRHATEPIVKIGRSDRPHSRALRLREAIDLTQSYAIETDARYASNVERMLHFVVSAFSVERDRGDGYTEWFALEALDEVRLFLGRSALKLKLEPISISAPRTQTSAANTRDRLFTQRSENDRHVDAAAIHEFICLFSTTFASCRIFRVVGQYEAFVYLRGRDVTDDSSARLSAVAHACDTSFLKLINSITVAEREMVLKLSLGYFKSRLVNDPNVMTDLRAWFEAIPILPAAGPWRRRFETLERTVWDMILRLDWQPVARDTIRTLQV